MENTLTNSKVKIGEDGELHCPYCKAYCLHQEIVETKFRDAEDSDGLLVRSSTSSMFSKRLQCSEIDGRRDSLEISFSCEHCGTDEISLLRIMQHKGTTYINWIEKKD